MKISCLRQEIHWMVLTLELYIAKEKVRELEREQ